MFTLWALGGIACGLASAVAPWKTVSRVAAAGSTAGVAYLPLIAMLTMGLLSILYGLVAGDAAVMLFNAAIVVLAVRYVAVYYRYAVDRAQCQRESAVAAGLCVLGLLCVVLGGTGETGRTLIGWLSSLVSVAFFGSPLAQVAEIWRTRDASSLIAPLVLANNGATLCWMLHGLTVHDLYISVPNAVALCLALVQLALLVLFGGLGNSKPTALPL